MTAVRDQLAAEIKACHLCPRLDKPPAAGYGSETSPVMIVGQSLCGPCVETGVPFTGGCESLLLEGLGAAGKVKKDVFITNVVHCHPPGNLRSRRDEKANCAQFLDRELAMVRPRLIVALGNDARDALTDKCRAVAQRPFNGAGLPARGPVLLHLTHPAHMLQWRRSECGAWAADLGAAVRWAFH